MVAEAEPRYREQGQPGRVMDGERGYARRPIQVEAEARVCARRDLCRRNRFPAGTEFLPVAPAIWAGMYKRRAEDGADGDG